MRGRNGRGNALRGAGLFALGTAAGAAIGLLAAPAAGRVTRQRMLARLRTAERRLGRRLSTTKRTLIRQAGQTYHQAAHWVAEHVANGNGGRHAVVAARRTVRRRIAHA